MIAPLVLGTSVAVLLVAVALLVHRGRRQEAEATALLGISRIPRGESYDHLLAEIHRVVTGFLDVSGVGLAALREDSFERLGGYPPVANPQVRWPIAGTAGGDAIAAKRPVVINDTSAGDYLELERVRSGGGRSYVVYPLYVGDRPHGALVFLSPRRDYFTPGRVRFLEAVSRQVSTTVHHAEQTRLIEEKNEEIRRASDAKTRFLALMSHELRTPLNSIIGFSEVLADGKFGPLNDRQSRYLGNVLESGRHLLHLINDLLDLSRIEAGRVELVVGRQNLRLIAGEAVAMLQPQAESKRITITIERSPPLPTVRADVVRLKQILYNLISNAIKFTPEGGRVRIGFANRPEGGKVRVTVADTGPGIGAEDAARLFQPFTQLPHTERRGGAGLGLALTRELVELMGGVVTLESVLGQGSSFHVDLPAGTLPPVEAPPPPEPHDPKGAPLVLVVDDDANARELIDLTLRDAGFQTLLTDNGEEALKLARLHTPALITLDIFLPGIDGWDVFRALRGDTVTASIPVVLVTISADRGRSAELGVTDHLVKPIDRQTLLDALARRNGEKGELLAEIDRLLGEREQG